MRNQQIAIYPTHYVLGKGLEDSFVRGRTMSGSIVSVYVKGGNSTINPRDLALAKVADHYCVADINNGSENQTGGVLMATGAMQVNQYRIVAEDLRIFSQDKDHQIISGAGYIDVNRRPAALLSAEQSLAQIKRQFDDGSDIEPRVVNELRETLKDPARYSYEAVIAHHSHTFNFTPSSSSHDIVSSCKDIMSHMGSAELPVEFFVRVFNANGSIDPVRSTHIRARSLESLNRYMTPCEILESLTQAALPAMRGAHAQIIPAQRFSLSEDAVYSLLNSNDFFSLVPECNDSGLTRDLHHMVLGCSKQRLSNRTVVSDIAAISDRIGMTVEINHDLLNCYSIYGQQNSGSSNNINPLNIPCDASPATGDPEDINMLMSNMSLDLGDDLLPQAEIINSRAAQYLEDMLSEVKESGSMALSIVKRARVHEGIPSGAAAPSKAAELVRFAR